MRGDIGEKRVLDLGSGTGIFAIGAALLGPESVTGIEIDPDAAEIARANSLKAGVRAEYLCADVRNLELTDITGPVRHGHHEPPVRGTERPRRPPFIDLALAVANVTYGIFNAGSRQFVQSYIAGRGRITDVIGGKFPIPRTFSFHRKARVEIEVEILRIAHGHLS
jgi:putative methylase